MDRYMGLRYEPSGLSVAPSLPPCNVSELTLRGVAFAGGTVRLTVNSTHLTLSRTSGAQLTVSTTATDASTSGGSARSVPLAEWPEVTVMPAQAVKLVRAQSPAAVAPLPKAPRRAASKRHVRWYHASGAQADIAVNEAWLSRPERRAAITGAYACCNFFMFNATTGALIADVAGNYSNRFSPFLSRGLSVHAHGMMNEQALKSGAALKAIPDLARFVEANGIDGVLVDYEPLDVSVAHAKLFAHWLSAAATAVHAVPVPSGAPRKEVGVNIADWSVVSPGLWHFYNDSGVDFMATMTPTYSETKRDWPFITSLTQAISPLAKIDVGVASSLQVSGPPGDHCRGAPFNTTFTDWGICNTTNSSLKPIP